MEQKLMEKEIKINLRYLKSKCDFEKQYFIGGVEEPNYIDELTFDIYEDAEFDLDEDEFKSNGKLILNISGSDRALYELGKFLINIALYETADPDFHEHIDGIFDMQKNDKVNLIVHKKGQTIE